jgi:hypothetical protein
MVGTTGFEPATSRTPSVRATRLRYVPTACTVCSVSLAFEKGQDAEEFFVQIEKKFALSLRGSFAARCPGVRARVRSGAFRGPISRSGGAAVARFFAVFLAPLFEMFTRAGDCKTFFVQQPLDFKNGLDIFTAVEAMAAGTLHRLQHGKFGFPIAQDEGLGRRQAADLANAE